MARPSLEEVLGGEDASPDVVATDVGDGGGEVAVDHDQRHADRAVVSEVLVVGRRDDAVHPVRDEQVEILPLALGAALGVAHQDAVAVLRQCDIELRGELAEERKGHRRDDDADAPGGHAVQDAGGLVRPVIQLRDGGADPLLGRLAEVPAVVEDS